METDVLRVINGIDIYPIISLVTFVIVFAGMLVWTASLDRTQLRTLSRLPLDETTPADATPADRRGAEPGGAR